MKISKEILFCIIILLLLSFSIGCSPKIPQLKYSAEIEKEFNAPFDKIWDSTLEVLKLSNTKIIMEDKTSGLIVCAMPIKERFEALKKFDISEPKMYMTIYIKKNVLTSSSFVYLTQRFRFGPYIGEMEETDKEFFKKLEAKLGG